MRSKALMIAAVFVMLLTGCSKPESIIPAAEWEDEHPDVYETYMRNSEMEATTFGGSVPIDYLEKYPELRTFYDGYGFSIEYLRARGHTYALEDVIHTQRPKAAASCFACKSADYLMLLEEEGVKANKMTFDEVTPMMQNTISCYDCHKNTPGVIEVSRSHFLTGITHLEKEYKPTEQVCAQCHVEYYQDPETKEIVVPWHNGVGTDDMLGYFDSIGYSDWTHPSTGTQLLKVQHPEFETYQTGLHAKFNLTCVDCHMPQTQGSGSESFKSHHWTSPLKTIESSCLGCHQDETAASLTAKVEGVQKQVEDKMNEGSRVLLELIDLLKAETASQTVSDQVLEEARNKHRIAQFKWDFVFVENSEGFHNKDLAMKNLQEAIDTANEGIALLK